MNFSLEVAKRVLDITSNDNMICSPFSISIILNTLVAGAEGKTLEQLLGLLDYQNVEEANAVASKLASVTRSNVNGDGPIVASANGVWLDKIYTLNSSFKELLQNAYKARVKVVDFHDKVNASSTLVLIFTFYSTRHLIFKTRTCSNLSHKS